MTKRPDPTIRRLVRDPLRFGLPDYEVLKEKLNSFHVIFMYKLILFILFLSINCNAQVNRTRGRFIGKVHAEWLDDGRIMRLARDFVYLDAKKVSWYVPKGAEVDGASIPKIFWSIIGGPFSGKYRNASVIHDYYCDQKSRSWEDVHRMFYEACLDGGVIETKAKIMYAAVYMRGPRWDFHTLACTDCKWVQKYDYQYDIPEGLEDEIFSWVESENPSLDDIQSRLDAKIDDLRRSLTVEKNRLEILLEKWKVKSPEKFKEYLERAEQIFGSKLFVALPNEQLILDLRELNDEMESIK